MAKQETAAPKKKSSGLGALLVIGTIGGIMYLGATNPSDEFKVADVSSAEREAQAAATFQKRCTVKRYGGMAFVMAQSHIKRRLNDPGSAKFGYQPAATTVDPASCTFTVLGEFSAKNGFGGRVRGSYLVKIKRTPDGAWAPVSVNVDG